MNLAELLFTAGFKAVGDLDLSVTITGLSLDSRSVKPNDLFIGRCEFAQQALNAGASFALRWGIGVSSNPKIITIEPIASEDLAGVAWKISAAFYGLIPMPLTLFAVTGTNGKTTVTSIVQELLSKNNTECALIGTIKYQLGNKILSATHTTPSAITLAELFVQINQQGISACALEVSSHALEQERILPKDIDVAIFTNLTRDHLDYHGSMQAYGLAKQKLFTSLPAQAVAIINLDDDFSKVLLAKTNASKVLTYAIDKPATLRAQNINYHLDGSCFELIYQNKIYQTELSIIGKHNIYNALAGALALISRGYSPDKVFATLKNIKGAIGRMQVVGKYNGASILVDYAHTPDATEHLLRSLQALSTNNIHIVFGCGGNRDKGKRAIMGRIASEYSDYIYITSDNPRFEDPLQIINDIYKGVANTQNCYINIDRRKAIADAINNLTTGDILVVAGKGHETYQSICGQDKQFNDAVIIKDILETLS